ncbi:MAG: DUF6298 domain-containing protein [Verrucomicrobiales bacterium]|nr:DUF6298 domain-containing protein [Verrucomicrobiales bacterium]
MNSVPTICAASFLCVAWVSCVTSALAAATPAPSISLTAGNQLVCTPDARSNRVPDFSYCGYAANERPIPVAPVRVVVEPKPGDSTARIQAALDYVGGLPVDSNGMRGAVLLLAGRHEVFGGLVISNSGVVLRGQGAGTNGTVLVAAGTDRRTLIRVTGRNDCVCRRNANWEVTDEYVPVGATSFSVRDATGLGPGAHIRLVRPSTAAWIERLGAADLGGGVGTGWKPGTRDIVWDRTIVSVEGNRVTIDAPITTALERELGGGYILVCDWPGRLSNVGVENIRLESAFDPANPKDEEHSWCAITLENAADCWVRQVTFKHFAGSAVAVYETCRRVTVQDCLSLEPVSELGGYRRHTFFTMGQQTLFLRCYAEHGRHDFSVGHCAAGPNAFVQCEAREALADSGPIESWASGVLYDNVVVDGNALTLGFRPGNNAGIGWSAANCVLWNCSASVIRCWNPPGAQNWSFGSWGGFEGDGIWRSSNDAVSPESLFVAQLGDRLGPEAAARVRLMPSPLPASTNPTIEQAQALAAASRHPAPQLKDYIAAAATREPIPTAFGAARPIEEIFVGSKPEVENRKLEILITNGWLTVAGKLLVGGIAKVAWWRGTTRPAEAPAFGIALTRFMPGRIGRGFTDDLEEVADALVATGQVALEHNYGLWYDRRRDDHQRVRRMDGDVLPPFFEQPWARSGQGTAWHGLSKYDLTKFNRWYWSRLRQFADICDRRGLVLLHQNYFQHNVLEAGAHWADFPWRTANNINDTGFPEPPLYGGGKRIFMAEQFYDVTHPVRRELHRLYIRQCLDNFTNNANVIQLTCAEFTGPLAFMQFWLDTIAGWANEKGMKPLVALSATKDVQDAILADPVRCRMVDVIDFRYWWRTRGGEFAPPGGKNLAPRQFERQWRGGRPTDLDLAGMALEYRVRFPGKVVICDFDSASWAWVCAGGSLPRLPRTTDSNLLAAIPQMQPWAEASRDSRFVLRQPGRQLLVYRGDAAELDLSAEPGAFSVSVVDTATGRVTRTGSIRAGRKVKLPEATVIWLVKE